MSGASQSGRQVHPVKIIQVLEAHADKIRRRLVMMSNELAREKEKLFEEEAAIRVAIDIVKTHAEGVYWRPD